MNEKESTETATHGASSGVAGGDAVQAGVGVPSPSESTDQSPSLDGHVEWVYGGAGMDDLERELNQRRNAIGEGTLAAQLTNDEFWGLWRTARWGFEVGEDAEKYRRLVISGEDAERIQSEIHDGTPDTPQRVETIRRADELFRRTTPTLLPSPNAETPSARCDESWGGLRCVWPKRHAGTHLYGDLTADETHALTLLRSEVTDADVWDFLAAMNGGKKPGSTTRYHETKAALEQFAAKGSTPLRSEVTDGEVRQAGVAHPGLTDDEFLFDFIEQAKGPGGLREDEVTRFRLIASRLRQIDYDRLRESRAAKGSTQSQASSENAAP